MDPQKASNIYYIIQREREKYCDSSTHACQKPKHRISKDTQHTGEERGRERDRENEGGRAEKWVRQTAQAVTAGYGSG